MVHNSIISCLRKLLKYQNSTFNHSPTSKQRNEINKIKWQHWANNILSFSDLCLECQCRVFLVSWNGLHWTLGHIYASEWMNISLLIHFTTPSPPYKLWENWKIKSKQTNKKPPKHPKNDRAGHSSHMKVRSNSLPFGGMEERREWELSRLPQKERA